MHYSRITRFLLPLAAVALSSLTQAQTQLDTMEQKAGYAIGASIGGNLSMQGLSDLIDTAALIDGLRDSLAGSLQLSQEEMMAVMQEFSSEQQAKAEAEAAEAAQAGMDFLSQNGMRDGVMTTESGLQYEVLSKTSDGSAPTPVSTDTVEVHYHGTLADGTVFDSSVQRGEPISFPLDGVIPGWTEGLQLMQVGDKFKFFIPPELGYGANPVGPIPANSVLIFEVELLGIQ